MTEIHLIDISSHQEGMDLATMFSKNKRLGGVVVKVSQGTGYVNPCARAWLDWLVENKKPAGTYHYLDLMGAEAEARHYVETVRPWLGKVALAVDYEEATLVKGTRYLKTCLDEVYRLTGIRPFVYCSQTVLQYQDFNAIAEAGYPFWMAQYADYNIVNGFLTSPWQSGSVAPFKGYAMHQYTSYGRLKGWSGNLDLDLFVGNAKVWNKLIKADAQNTAPPKLKPPDELVVSEVLAGRYGTGEDRVKALRTEGYDPSAVQGKINELYAVAGKVRPLVADDMEYLNSIMKIVRSM